jgi:hypothetical protein
MVNGHWPQTLHPRRLLQWYNLWRLQLALQGGRRARLPRRSYMECGLSILASKCTDFYRSDTHASIGLKPKGQAFFRSPRPSLGASSTRLVSVKMPSETWKRKTCSGGHGLKPFLTFVTIIFPVACSPQPKLILLIRRRYHPTLVYRKSRVHRVAL